LPPRQFAPGDRVGDRRDFSVRQRRVAARCILGEQKFEHDQRIDVVAQQMAGEPGQ
jgi:hypothetical protein